jgi:serine/threonine protein kinase
LFFVCVWWQQVPFFIGCAGYVAPEVFVSTHNSDAPSSSSNVASTSRGQNSSANQHHSGFKSDVWSLGIVLLQVRQRAESFGTSAI